MLSARRFLESLHPWSVEIVATLDDGVVQRQQSAYRRAHDATDMSFRIVEGDTLRAHTGIRPMFL